MNLKIFTTDNGHTILEVGCKEMKNACNSLCICDFCGEQQTCDSTGFYIPVLNKWYCKKCYAIWEADCKYYPEDEGIAERNYIRMTNNILL